MAAPRVLGWVNTLLGLAFVMAAGLQLNDPDPVPWIAIYLGAALGCALYGRAAVGPMVAAAVGAVALVWAAAIAAGVDRALAVGELFGSMEMKGGPVEQTRELGGLGLVGLWMIVLAVFGWRARARREAHKR